MRAALFSLAPLLLSVATYQVNAGVMLSIGAMNEGVVSTLGANNINFQEGPSPSRSKLVATLLVGCFANAVSFVLVTLVGTTGTVLAVPLVALGVSVAMALRFDSGLDLVGLTAAVVFTVGVGLPGGKRGSFGRKVLVDARWRGVGSPGGAAADVTSETAITITTTDPGRATNWAARPSQTDIFVHSLAVAITFASGWESQNLPGSRGTTG